MAGYVAFLAVALSASVCVVILSLKYNVGNASGWVGSILMILSTVLILGTSSDVFNLLANIVFIIGVLVFLSGLYRLIAEFNGAKVDQRAEMQGKIISDILQVAATRESLMELLNYSLDRFLEVFSLNSGSIHIFHGAKNVLVMGAYRGLSPSHANKLELIKPGESAIGRTVQNKRVLIIRDLRVSPDYQFFGGKAEGYSFLSVVPVMVNGDCWGVITLLGRKKYHRGMLDVNRLEQFGLKLGQALKLGRENRRMASAFGHMRKIMAIYDRLFDNFRANWTASASWQEGNVFDMLEGYSGRLFGGKPFYVFKISSGKCRCIYQPAQQEAPAGSQRQGISVGAESATLPTTFKFAEFFKIDAHELAQLLPERSFKNDRPTGYGFSGFRGGMLVIDESREIVVRSYIDDVALIKNVFTLESILGVIQQSRPVVSRARPDQTEAASIAQDLSTVFTGISGNIRFLLDRLSKDGRHIDTGDFVRWLKNAEKSALRGIELISGIGKPENANAVIQSVLESEKLNVEFYPASQPLQIRSDLDDFRDTVIKILREVVKNDEKPGSSGRIKLRLSSHNQLLALTIEGATSQSFPSDDLIEKARRHNLEINILNPDKGQGIASRILPDTPTSSGLSILVVENKPVIKELLADLFARMGHSFEAVSSADEGLAYLNAGRDRGEPFDVALIDMALEDIPGLDLCKTMKQIDSQLYTVIISSWGANYHTNSLNDAGVDAVLHKPFRWEQLSRVLPERSRRDAAKK